MSRRPCPKAAWILYAVVLTQSTLAFADGPDYPEGTQGGQKLAAELRNLRPENASWTGDLKIRTRGPNGRVTTLVPVTGQAEAGDTQWRVFYTAGGTNGWTETLTVIHTLGGTNQYLFTRTTQGEAPGQPKSLAGSGAEISFAGSDFWLSDLGFEFYHWPVQRLLKGEMRRGRPCFVLESSNPQAKAVGYSRVVSFIDRESGGPIQAEAYGPDGKLLKEFGLGSFKKVNGRWELKRMEIENDRTRSRTVLEFDLNSQTVGK